MSENAPLQNRFSESGCEWRTGIKFQRRAMKVHFMYEVYFGSDPALDWKEIVDSNFNDLRLARHCCAEDLAARHFFPAALGRG